MAGDVAANRVRVCAVLGADDLRWRVNDSRLIGDLKLLSLKFFSHFFCAR
jgi:hypothetical protein